VRIVPVGVASAVVAFWRVWQHTGTTVHNPLCPERARPLSHQPPLPSSWPPSSPLPVPPPVPAPVRSGGEQGSPGLYPAQISAVPPDSTVRSGLASAVRRLLLSSLTLCLAGCNPLANPGEWVLAAGDGDDPAETGPFAVGTLDARVKRWWLSDFDYTIWYPATNTGEFDFEAAPAPILVLIPDVMLDPSEYDWLGKRLASWGLAVVAPELPYGVPGMGLLRPSALLDRVIGSQSEETFWAGGLDTEAVVVLGHGWGDGLADNTDTLDTRVVAEVLLFGAPWYSPGGKAGPALILLGEEDCESSVEGLQDTFLSFGPETTLAQFAQMSHRRLTDDAAELPGCTVSLTRESARERISLVLVPWLLNTLGLPLDPAWLQTSIEGVVQESH